MVSLVAFRPPLLGVGRVGDYCVRVQRLKSLHRVRLVEHRPVIGQTVTVAGDDVVGLHAAHDQVHTGEVIGVLAQLLGEVLNTVWVTHALGDGLADVKQ
ncbi:hypothetical protein FRC0061_00746 [Corynebacterium diphtheriae]|nr:hypothetical protein FRC0061_00746 [Corynebacterium diphtheriae]